MSRSTTEKTLKDVEDFLGSLAQNQMLVKSTDPKLRDIAAQARHLESDIRDAIQQVHRHWERG